MQIDLPTPLSNYFEAQNSQNIDAMISEFCDDASVRDEGQTIVGRERIRVWIEDTTRKYRVNVTPAGVRQLDGKTVVTAQVEGTFPGSPVTLKFRFAIVDQKISDLEIGG